MKLGVILPVSTHPSECVQNSVALCPRLDWIQGHWVISNWDLWVTLMYSYSGSLTISTTPGETDTDRDKPYNSKSLCSNSQYDWEKTQHGKRDVALVSEFQMYNKNKNARQHSSHSIANPNHPRVCCVLLYKLLCNETVPSSKSH